MGACHDETTYTTPTPDAIGYLPCKVQMRQGEMFNKTLPMQNSWAKLHRFMQLFRQWKFCENMHDNNGGDDDDDGGDGDGNDDDPEDEEEDFYDQVS